MKIIIFTTQWSERAGGEGGNGRRIRERRGRRRREWKEGALKDMA